jgi:small subunit ribosomal protein S1
MTIEDEDLNQEDFASMLEESLEPRSFTEGEMVEGTVVSIGSAVVFVDIGGKGEASIDAAELAEEDGQIDVQVGDVVQGVVVSTRGGVTLSHKLARGAITSARLQDAYRSGLPVEGRVEKSNKGGYDVLIGNQRAFCPISQIDNRFTDDPTIHEGQRYTFRITEFSEGGKNIVVSRRALLEAEEAERAEEVRGTIVVDAELAGKVASVQSYGAFVDLGGGIQGLLHVSEMGWSRVSNPNEVVQPGDEITVKVLRVEDDGKKIALGLKQLGEDPWSTADETYEVGQVLGGRVVRVAEFGVFVELEPGIEGLAHASTFPPTGTRDGWKSSIVSGASVAVELLSFEPDRKRIGLAIVPEGSVRAGGSVAETARGTIAPGALVTGKVERHENYGLFVFLAPGKTGLVPLAETGVEREGDIQKKFPVGSDLTVMVLEVDPSSRRIRLSIKAIAEAEQRREAQDYAKSQESESSSGFGTLADKLRSAMKR